MAMYNTKLNYNGEPCTWRHVSTVRGQALGNLPQKCGKAPSAEPTISCVYYLLLCNLPHCRSVASYMSVAVYFGSGSLAGDNS